MNDNTSDRLVGAESACDDLPDGLDLPREPVRAGELYVRLLLL